MPPKTTLPPLTETISTKMPPGTRDLIRSLPDVPNVARFFRTAVEVAILRAQESAARAVQEKERT